MKLFDIQYKYSIEEDVFNIGVIRGVPENKLHMMVTFIIGKKNVMNIKETVMTQPN